MSKSQKIYVRPDNTVVLTCPYCSLQREVNVALFRGKKDLNIMCCNRFKVIIEFRKRVRKKTQLEGTYINHSQKDHEDNLTVQVLSISGLAFTCSDSHLFNMKDELTIEFILNDEHETVITKEAIVRNMRESSVGCEFTSGDELVFTGPLGYYVMHVLP